MGNWAEEALGDLYAPGGAYKEAVMQNTWGHLAPQKNITYKGKLLISNSGYGNSGQQIVEMEWNNLQDNPWIYDFVHNWLWDNRELMKDDGIYLINTTFRNYRMWGKPIKIMCLKMLEK